MKNTFLIILFSCILYSCEDIIEIDLKSSEPVVVIEGIIHNNEGPYRVQISRSTDFYEPGIYPGVEGASVLIHDDQGNSEILREESPGLYLAETISGLVGHNYTLNVSIEGKDFVAESFMPEVVDIDSMEIEIFPGGYFIEGGFIIHCFFTDPPETGNNYRLTAYFNGKRDANFYLVNDKFTNGNTMEMLVFSSEIAIGDTVVIELHSIDENVFKYYNTLASLVTEQGGGNPANPANPVTNLSNGGLGYFGAIAISQSSIIIQ